MGWLGIMSNFLNFKNAGANKYLWEIFNYSSKLHCNKRTLRQSPNPTPKMWSSLFLTSCASFFVLKEILMSYILRLTAFQLQSPFQLCISDISCINLLIFFIYRFLLQSANTGINEVNEQIFRVVQKILNAKCLIT